MRSGSPKATASGEGARVEPEPVECGDPQRCGHQVTGVVEPPVGCAIGETVLATYTTRSSEIAARRTCLIPNFHADRCYTEHEVDLHEYKLAECAAADFRITKVADEPTISCDPDSGPYEFPRAGKLLRRRSRMTG